MCHQLASMMRLIQHYCCELTTLYLSAVVSVPERNDSCQRPPFLLQVPPSQLLQFIPYFFEPQDTLILPLPVEYTAFRHRQVGSSLLLQTLDFLLELEDSMDESVPIHPARLR